jgi:GT2 family glycosyltransferase
MSLPNLKRQADLNDLSPLVQRAIWAGFDAEWYRGQHPELRGMPAEELEAFYRTEGCRLGHSPNPYFNESWYLATYKDVAEQIAEGTFPSGFEHYLAAGHADRSAHWLFSERFYLAGNTDLTQSRLEEAGFVNGYDHYLTAGDAEFRTGHLFFNPELYLAALPAAEPGGPFTRFVRGGCAAGSTVRLSWYFDPEWYLRQYPEVAKEIASGGWTCALHHYLYNDTPRRFDPNAFFSEEYYVSVHVDVVAAIEKGQFRNSYDHFIQFGVFESRKPAPEVDLAGYFRIVEVQAEIQNGRFRDVFASYVAKRLKGELIEAPPLVSEHLGKALFTGRARALRPLFARQTIGFPVPDQPDVSVILVMFNQVDLTLNTLDSLRRCHPGPIELILVDSGSSDESRHIERYVTGAKIVRFSHNAGYIESCNAALAHVTAPVTVFMNNDILLERGAVTAAIARLNAVPANGAVGGKIIRTNGKLQEAGCIIWRDGSTTGYLRDADPNLPEANFVREVDFCSGVFLAVRSDLVKQVGGFDPQYKPAYFEETDLCIRLYEAGYKVIYDPSIMITHQEYSSGDSAIATVMMTRNHPVFRKKNLEFLRTKYPRNPDLVVQARSPRTTGYKILFIEDRIPLRHLGSGFTRSNDIILTMAALGHHVTVFPIYQPVENVLQIYREFPDTVEIIHDREMKDLAAFIEERSGYFDILWISRTHNAERLMNILMDMSLHLPINRIVLDTEAVVAARNLARDAAEGRQAESALDAAVQKELASAYFCQKIVAVNEADAVLIRDSGLTDVSVLGHVRDVVPTARPFIERRGLLFVGAIHDQDSPNLDGLEWFVAHVLPLLDAQLPEDVLFTIAGYVNRRIDLSPLARVRRVDLRGAADDLAPLYDSHRLFVAPTRFAGGIPFKLHEAASFGLPIVASELLCGQVGWHDGQELLSGDVKNPEQFAAQILRLYEDEPLWHSLRDNALARLAAENSPAFFREALSGILADVGQQ